MELHCGHCGLDVKVLDEIRERLTSSYDRWQCPDCNFVCEIEKERAITAGESNPYRRTLRQAMSDEILVLKQIRKLERPFKKRELAKLRARKRQLAKQAERRERGEYGAPGDYAPYGKDFAMLTVFGIVVTLLTLFGK